VLRLENVSFGYRSETTITDVSFAVEAGAFTALLGENGAGKSTLVRLCNGLLKPASGSVTVLGRDTAKAKTSALARDVGFLFQNPDRQLCQNTVRAELLFGLEYASVGAEEYESRCDEMLALFSLDGARDPFGMSRSERQQVALASVLARRPRLLLLDEPTTGLDYRECMNIMDILSRINSAGTAILMITHDMELVADFARRALILSRGRLIGDGSARELMRDRALFAEASLLPAQIPALGMSLGGEFADAFTVDDMVRAAEKIRRETAT
jgi:energy-coupling factor transport system ATP-binding protein